MVRVPGRGHSAPQSFGQCLQSSLFNAFFSFYGHARSPIPKGARKRARKVQISDFLAIG